METRVSEQHSITPTPPFFLKRSILLTKIAVSLLLYGFEACAAVVFALAATNVSARVLAYVAVAGMVCGEVAYLTGLVLLPPTYGAILQLATARQQHPPDSVQRNSKVLHALRCTSQRLWWPCGLGMPSSLSLAEFWPLSMCLKVYYWLFAVVCMCDGVFLSCRVSSVHVVGCSRTG